MFSKILIANRGEIACRIIRTVKKMGIKSVAIYSDVDSSALHVGMADESVCVGSMPNSYMSADAIIAACKKMGAEAVHPGYGFLSENSAFAESLLNEGITFIGPDSRAIKKMGDKIEAKKIAKEAGVNIMPGPATAVANINKATCIAKEIGFPVILKASAGGGGKGMRVAKNINEVRDGFERAASEAQSTFGDGRIFVEKFIEEPRHIEIQVLADCSGNTIYLGERECSIQRRHQKIIEEAPSSFLCSETRDAMGKQSVALAKAVDYSSAGTVEFLVDQNQNFFFIEMNTRIQVEHAITEAVTGLDIVEQMICIADGQKLNLKQEDVKTNGVAIEARIYAEDPSREFLPSIGRLTRYEIPSKDRGVRVDTGVFEGSEISIYYDPMIAKVIAHRKARNAALDALGKVLERSIIRGVKSNLNFLNHLIRHPFFIKNEISTNFLSDQFPCGFNDINLSENEIVVVILVASVAYLKSEMRAIRSLSQNSSNDYPFNQDFTAIINRKKYHIILKPKKEGYEALVNSCKILITTQWLPGEEHFNAIIGSQNVCVSIWRNGIFFNVVYLGVEHQVLVIDTVKANLYFLMPEKKVQNMSNNLKSPMPGLMVKIFVVEGATVQAGEELCIIEAMKMENVLRADRNAVVGEVMAKAGDSLTVDQTILTFK